MSMLLGEDSLSVRSRVAISNGYMSSTVVYIVASVVPAAGPRPNTHVPVTEVIVVVARFKKLSHPRNFDGRI